MGKGTIFAYLYIMLNETHIHVHIHPDERYTDELKSIHKILKTLLMNNTELKELLTSANAKVDKITTEVQALIDAINSNPDVPAEIADLANALGTKLQAVDDLNPDAPVV